MKFLIELLRGPINANIDGSERLALHSHILQKKNMLRELFRQTHDSFYALNRQFFTSNGLEVELGSGVSPMRDTYPHILATDIVPASHLDETIDAEAMTFSDESIRSFYAQNCFHHFAHPNRFFNELVRVLKPGGGVIILEPYYGVVASFLYKRLFAHEQFDKTAPSWETHSTGPMSGANQALSYLVFVRDRQEFEKKYPMLKIVYQKPTNNYLKYLASGGLNFRQLCPNALSPIINALQWCLSPFNRWLALHHIIVIKKIQ